MKSPSNRCALLRTLPQGSVGAEVGVCTGRFSSRMLNIVRPSLLWLVDAWSPVADTNRLDGKPYEERLYLRWLGLTMYRMRLRFPKGQVRVLCASSKDASPFVPDTSLDWVYIDASHDYWSCLDDLWRWSKKVKPHGMVMGHDYQLRGVRKAVKHFVRDEKWSGPQVTQDRYPSFWLRKKSC